MAQVLFAADATPSLADLDANFTELYNTSLRTSGSGIGYAAGAGGAVTQATSKSTAVTLNKVAGQITMHNAALAAGATVAFAFTNSAVANIDVVVACVAAGVASSASYRVQIGSIFGGVVGVSLTNISGGSLSESVVLNFVVIKGAVT